MLTLYPKIKLYRLCLRCKTGSEKGCGIANRHLFGEGLFAFDEYCEVHTIIKTWLAWPLAFHNVKSWCFWWVELCTAVKCAHTHW